MANRLKLLNLTLKNFKGVRSFVLDAQGENIQIFGDNATGKTTIFDAFVWLLFDKDSQNKKDFSIKTLDDNGKELHGLDHEVEGTLLIDGQVVSLRKVYKEKWTKKRGSATSEFSGHTTDYYIDSVPSKKKEFSEKIASIIDEDIFKLLTSPSFFNEQLKWQDRRKTLLEICGDITDEEVINSNRSLTKLPAILQGRSIEDQRKIIAAKRTEINKELEKIPVRIDEIQHSLPDLTGVNKAAIESDIHHLNGQIDEKQDLISNIRNGNAIAQKQKTIQEIEIDLLTIKQQHESGARDVVYSLKARIQEEESNSSILKSKLENVKNSKRYNDDHIKRIDEQLQQMRQEWHEVNEQDFSHNEQCECPTCGQSLPEEQVVTAREKALSQFNLNKSSRLEEINARGQKNKERKEEYIQENDRLAKEYEKLNDQIAEKVTLIEKAKVQLDQLESDMKDVTENTQYVEKLQEKQKLVQEIQNLKAAADQSIQEIQMEIITIKSERDHLQAELGKFAAVSQSEARVQELEAQERKLAAEYESLEQQLYLTEEFIRTKVNMLEEKINSKFQYARFKLFETQINGGLTEVCTTTYNGVPYDSGLNNAAKINAGLDIINTLSKHYGFLAPIFVDNAEAVTRLIDTDSQLISLVVSENDKTLRVDGFSNQLNDELPILNLEVI